MCHINSLLCCNSNELSFHDMRNTVDVFTSLQKLEKRSWLEGTWYILDRYNRYIVKKKICELRCRLLRAILRDNTVGRWATKKNITFLTTHWDEYFDVFGNLGPDCLDSPILKITGKTIHCVRMAVIITFRFKADTSFLCQLLQC